MRFGWLKLIVCTVVVLSAVAQQVSADISNAAVLYLRIAPGARAAGMGEAFVAISDDATATHWNPAGLGSYPLADSWIDTKIPEAYRPIRGVAAIKQSSGSDYTSYEVWALTPKGLARYDNKDWYLDEKFNTKTDQTVERIVSSYFNVDDDERLQDMIRKVAVANNRREFEVLEELRDQIQASLPEEGYDGIDALTTYLDSLTTSFWECRVNWDRVEEAEKHLNEGLADESLSELELDRIAIAIEKSRNRFIPEELTIPYSVNFTGEPKAIASTEKSLLVATDYGLAWYNGKRWRTITVADGLPSDTVLCLAPVEGEVLIGTSKGPARFAGLRLGAFGGMADLPDGPVTAMGARGLDNIWMILGEVLYHYDGRDWSTSFEYRVMIDDTPEKIAERFAVYGTPVEKQQYLQLYQQANEATGGWGEEYVEPLKVEEAEPEALPEDIMSAVQQGTDTIAVVDEADSLSADETAAADTVLAEADEITPVADREAATAEAMLEPGYVVRAPLAAGIRGRVNTIYVGRDMNVWLGTEHGLLFFDGSEWAMPGYRQYRLKPEDSFEDLVDAKRHDDDAARDKYAEQIKAVNDIEESSLEVDRVIRIYRNPNASEIHSIARHGRRLYLATEAGLVEFDGVYWARAAVQNLGITAMTDAKTMEDELWLASESKLVAKAGARNQFTFMHVKWLPELADDVYYEFLSYVAGTENWGTFGGNITFITYGSMKRTSQFGDTLEDFTSFDLALTGSYGAALSNKLKVGLSTKLMYSKLSDIGTGLEKGRGTSTGFAVDFGMLYNMTRRLTLGAAMTNLGPKMAYIDASQADELPRNLAVGFAYRLLNSDYYTLLVTSEVNKIMVGLDDGFTEELKQLVINSGAEFVYADIFALRAGYIHDEEGDVKTPTLGVGVSPTSTFKFDFSYIPSGSNEALKNTLRMSLSVLP